MSYLYLVLYISYMRSKGIDVSVRETNNSASYVDDLNGSTSPQSPRAHHTRAVSGRSGG
jgi:hypothetical protein